MARACWKGMSACSPPYVKFRKIRVILRMSENTCLPVTVVNHEKSILNSIFRFLEKAINLSKEMVITTKKSKIHVDFLKMFRDGYEIGVFCTKSENSDWKHMWLLKIKKLTAIT